LVERDTQHVSLTGGEPTLLGDDLFAVLDTCRHMLPRAQLLLLTNGRMCYYNDYARELADHGGRRMTVATTLHSATPEVHDRITGAPGSFEQTLVGIRNLRACGTSVEVRIVIQKANCHYLHELAQLIASEVRSLVQVSFMGLEMSGNAAKYRDVVWVDPREVSGQLGSAIRDLLQQGIASRIYNLPLCAVDPAYWSLCAKSISNYKRTYKAECARCTVRDHCGGLFGTALNHRLTRVMPIEGGDVRP
jgi:His-Xaa-Ser system radical SAM maturase HxsC